MINKPQTTSSADAIIYAIRKTRHQCFQCKAVLPDEEDEDDYDLAFCETCAKTLWPEDDS